MADSADDLELVRVAASSRPFLLRGGVFVALFLLAVGIDAVVESRFPDLVGVIVYPMGAFVWWLNRRNAVWIERDMQGVRVLTRRWWKYQDLWSGKLRATGKVLNRFPADVAVTYDSGTASWWRSDRSLTVDGIRFCVYPESVKLAAALGDDRRWTRAEERPQL